MIILQADIHAQLLLGGSCGVLPCSWCATIGVVSLCVRRTTFGNS